MSTTVQLDPRTELVRPTAAEIITPKASRRQALDAVVRAASCTRTQAGGFLTWLHRLVVEARASNYCGHFLTERELECYHGIFVQVIPDQTRALPGDGSAQAIVEDYVLDRARGELGLWHDMGTVAEATYCTVTVLVNAVN